MVVVVVSGSTALLVKGSNIVDFFKREVFLERASVEGRVDGGFAHWV